MLRGMMRGRSPPRYGLCAKPEKQNMKKEKAGRERACGGCGRFFHPVLRDKPDIRLKKEWLFSIRRSRCFNPSSSPSARFCPSGAALTCWKVTAGTTLARMLMCGKVTNDNLIDSSHYFRNTDQYEKLMWGFSYISFCLSKHFGESDVFVSFLLTASL